MVSCVRRIKQFIFQNATKILYIIENSYLTNNANDVLDKAVFKYENHPSILAIKNSLGATTPCFFNQVSLSDIEEELSNFNKKNLLYLKIYRRRF